MLGHRMLREYKDVNRVVAMESQSYMQVEIMETQKPESPQGQPILQREECSRLKERKRERRGYVVPERKKQEEEIPDTFSVSRKSDCIACS